MSFTIKLQTNKSARNALYKTVSDIREVTGTLRDESSIINPIITFRIDDVSALKKCNYMTIAEFDRKYFVDDIISVRNTIIQVKGHVDVLSTYADEILSNDAIISRSGKSGYYNTYLEDDKLATYQDSYVCNYKFSQHFSSSNDNLILAVAGSSQS